jgi:pyridoxine 5'-phosphate synthase PdxJ
MVLVVCSFAGASVIGGVSYLRLREDGCSRSTEERLAIFERVQDQDITALLKGVTNVQSAEVDWSFSAVGVDRDYSLDQGPQRACLVGSGRVSASTEGGFTVLLRIYDSPEAARSNASSNLAADSNYSLIRDSGIMMSDVICTRSGVGGLCEAQSVQAIDASVSVVVRSQNMTGGFQDGAVVLATTVGSLV